jgi:hypothetical protein
VRARTSWLQARGSPTWVGYPSIRLVCISAGGNDFAGVGDLDDKLLKPGCSGEANAEGCSRAGQPAAAFAAIGDSYQELVSAIAAQRPDMTVLVHNYDYAIPDGRALPGVRSWLKLPLDNCRVPTQGAPLAGVRRELVRDLIDRFTRCPDEVVAAGRGPGRRRSSSYRLPERSPIRNGPTGFIPSLAVSRDLSTIAGADRRVARSASRDRNATYIVPRVILISAGAA